MPSTQREVSRFSDERGQSTMTTFATNPPSQSRPERELIPADSPLAPYVSVNPGRMHGEPCFAGTRVPIQTLFDHLEVDNGLNQFLQGFPNVSREMAVALIGLASRGLLEGLRHL
jgi:uncharacterized protein (DUF433 family)